MYARLFFDPVSPVRSWFSGADQILNRYSIVKINTDTSSKAMSWLCQRALTDSIDSNVTAATFKMIRLKRKKLIA